ncbi:MAG: ferritin-like domain-containing protein [Fuerstiella sp.]|nr:ferritin-like domain-containing protein [Fuerstiella sp.]
MELTERAEVSADSQPLIPELRSREWLDYFTRNTQQLLDVPWQLGSELSDQEVKAISASVQGFQLGESSEGKHLIHCAKLHSEETCDPEYFDAIKLFIREEQRHARDLARFLDLNGISTLKAAWPDSVFRFLRRGAGLELSIAVLVTAEIIAEVYYPALQAATNSIVLKRLCDQIIQDETPHVQFQCERLAILRSRRSPVRCYMTCAAQRFLFLGTCLVVWMKHGPVFRQAKQGFRPFWKAAWQKYHVAETIMRRTPN